MDVVKRKRSKGGFFNLFDWPAKSRKRLFSNSSEIPDLLRKSKENLERSSRSQVSVMEVDEIGKSSIYNLRSDSSCCASSVTSDDAQGTRAPSVVARLMGLESLPLPNALETRFNLDVDPFFLRSSHSANPWNEYKNQGNANIHGNVDGDPWNHADSRTIRGLNRPIERFQTETLPPRSAKPISVTHNRLLSPIRSPRFVPSKNPAYVMEEASRMIQPSPQVVTRTRVSRFGSSSVPLRIRDLKEKVESARKPPKPQSSNDTCNNKYPGGKQKGKRSMASPVTPVTSKIMTKGVSDGLKGKVKPSSPPAQAMASIDKQDGSSPSHGNKRTSTGQKGIAEAKNRLVKSQNGDRGLSRNTGKTVLNQNNQKQNCRDMHQATKASVPNQQCKKVMNKVVNKVIVESETESASKKSGSPPLLPGKGVSSSQKKNLRNKKSPYGVQEPRISNGLHIRRSEKPIKCNITIDNDLITAKDDYKKDMDVISFTFSSPINGLSSASRSSTQGEVDSAVSFNVIGGDSLNLLLEQKLKELSSKMKSSSCNLIQEESSDSTSKERVIMMSSYPSKSEKSTQNGINNSLSENESASDCIFSGDNCKSQMGQYEEHEISSSSSSTVMDADDPGLSCDMSCSDCEDNTADGMKQCSSDQELTWASSKLSEYNGTLAFWEAEERLDWEFDYITEILSSDQLMLKEFAMGVIQDVIPVSLFHETDSQGDPMAKIERKTLFDCVNQCLRVKCEQTFMGSCKGLVMKHGIMLARRDWLAEELNREIQGLKKMREMMVDELVDKDMSMSEGRWLDHDKEGYEEGIEIEREIVSALVNDLVDDLLLLF